MKHTNGNTRSRRSATAETLFTLYTEDLKDIYWAEKHLLKALPKTARAAYAPDLKAAFEDHLDQTETHVERLEKAFSDSGIKVGARKCEGMEGLVKEGEEVIGDHEAGSVRDAGLIIAAQKVEHYEIAAYGSLRTLARILGFLKAAELFQATLDEESDTDKTLTRLSETVNEEAFDPSASEMEPAESER